MPQNNIEKREIKMDNAELFPHIIDLLNQGHTVTLRLRGNSMRPFLEDRRDIAILKKPTDIVVGEPVLAEISKGVYVLHRIIDINGENITLLGDGNINTEHCTKSDVRAQVVGFKRKGREVADTIDSDKWKAYSRLWTALRPIRRYLLAFYRRWAKVFGPI